MRCGEEMCAWAALFLRRRLPQRCLRWEHLSGYDQLPSVVLVFMMCLARTCNDGVKNGQETDVDCGGPCLPSKKCADTKGCDDANDCISGVCTGNICQGWFHALASVFSWICSSSGLQ